MFGGGFEFVFILFIAFLLFGPKRIPGIARALGKGLGEFRRASNELRSSFEGEICGLDSETKVERNAVPANVVPEPSDQQRDRMPEPRATLD